MRGRGNAKRETYPPGNAGATDAFEQLVELQRQILELVEKNSEAERRCRLLRDELARETEELFVQSRSIGYRLRRAATTIWKKTSAIISRRPPSVDQLRPDLTLLPNPPRHAQSH